MAEDFGSRYEEIAGLFRASRLGAGGSSENPEAHEMAANRQISQRVASAIGGGSGLSLATSRPRDPLWYWKQGNLPYNIWDDATGEQIQSVRELCRLLYVTHPLLGSAIDIYARYPLAGMEIVCPKDPSIADFHSELFLDDLNYEEHLVDIGREYWLVGEGFPLASFNELTGVFDSDEMQLPEDVNVIRTPFSNEPRFEMALPFRIRRILTERYPELEYNQLVDAYPEFLALNQTNWITMLDRNRYMIPVSNRLMSHVMRRGDTFHDRGIPIMMRAFRAIAQEEMLNAAQDSISQRLYTPLILARIGASATDLGTQTPWVPTAGDLAEFSEDVNAALAADFRMITTHFAVNMQNVFGRESMPRLQGDFERLEDKMLQAFGLSRTMLSGASGGQTYAADALNRDLVTQLLVQYQKSIVRFFQGRAAVVAEAQGHYDFERKGGRVRPIMEMVQETDEETGEIRFVERPKLLLPDLKIKSMNVKDEESLEKLLSQLRAEGVPISQESRLVNIPIDLDEEEERTIEENVRQIVRKQEERRRSYLGLMTRGLPIPQDLKEDFEAKVDDSGPNEAASDGEPEPPAATPSLGVGIAPFAPPDEEDPQEGPGDPLQDAPAFKPLPRQNKTRQRPPESDEQRKDMPKASGLSKAASHINRDDPDDEPYIHELISFSQFVDKEEREIALSEEGDLTVDGKRVEDDDLNSLDVPEDIREAHRLPVIGSYTTRHMREGRHLAWHYRVDEFEDEQDD